MFEYSGIDLSVYLGLNSGGKSLRFLEMVQQQMVQVYSATQNSAAPCVWH